MLHPALLKDSGWKYHPRFRMLRAARYWGCPSPGYFDALPKREKREILAFYEAEMRISAIDSYEAQEEAKREAKRKSSKPSQNKRPIGRRRG